MYTRGLAAVLGAVIWVSTAFADRAGITPATQSFSSCAKALSSSAFGVSTETFDLDIVSINARNFDYIDGAFIKPHKHLKQIADVIAARRPHVVIMQEVGSAETLEKFSAKYLNDEYSVSFSPGPRHHMYTGFLVRRDLPFDSKMESHDKEVFEDPINGRRHKLFLHDAPGLILFKKGTRYAVAVIIGHHGKSRHLPDSLAASRDQQQERVEQWQKEQTEGLRRLVSNYEKRFGRIPVIIGGDFNVDVYRQGETLSSLRKEMFEVFTLKEVPAGLRYTHLSFFFGGSEFMPSQMDAFFINDHGAAFVKEAGVDRYRDLDGHVLGWPENIDQRDLLFPSDHLPLFMRVAVPTDPIHR